jgi:hypothetical protein
MEPIPRQYIPTVFAGNLSFVRLPTRPRFGALTQVLARLDQSTGRIGGLALGGIHEIDAPYTYSVREQIQEAEFYTHQPGTNPHH